MGAVLSHGAADWREGRRLRAWELHEAGWPQAAIAEALGVTPGAVSQWMRRAREAGGGEALRKRTVPGAACRLSEEQQAQILDWLREGAEAHGFRGALWTRTRVATLVARKLGVRYHPGHVSKLLKGWGWSPQVPERRARQRDEDAIERWRTERWPAIKKGAVQGRRTLLFVDESGCYLLPAVARTYAPVGATPILRHRLTREHLSVIGAVGLDAKLYFQVHDHAITSAEATTFLRHLLRHIPGKLLVLWDGAPIHRSRVVKQFLHDEARGRLHLERFPGYAPELDPQEGIGRHLKYVELRNLCCADLAEARRALRAGCQRLRQKPNVIHACVAHAGLV